MYYIACSTTFHNALTEWSSVELSGEQHTLHNALDWGVQDACSLCDETAYAPRLSFPVHVFIYNHIHVHIQQKDAGDDEGAPAARKGFQCPIMREGLVVKLYGKFYPNTRKARITYQRKVVSLYVKHVCNIYIYTQ